MTIKLTKELAADPQNPRKISAEQRERLKKSLEAYGDLSGIVFNRRTRTLVGGHQRISILGDECKIEAKYFDKPDKHGTVGMGYITLPDKSKHSYREVDWPKELQAAANIAANANGGEWEEQKLREMLVLAAEGEGEGAVDAETLGFTDDFMEKLMRGTELVLNVQEQEAKSLTEPLTITELKNLPSQTSMVQLFYTLKTRPVFLETVRKLQVIYGTPNITETVTKAIDFAYENRPK